MAPVVTIFPFSLQKRKKKVFKKQYDKIFSWYKKLALNSKSKMKLSIAPFFRDLLVWKGLKIQISWIFIFVEFRQFLEIASSC